MAVNFFQYTFLFLALTCLSTSSPLADDSRQDDELRTVLPPIKVGAGKIYYVQTFFKTNWYRAQQACKFQGLDLASINNQEESDSLSENLMNAGFSSYDIFWTSGQDLGNNGSWVWASTGYSALYTNWLIGEPNNLGGTNERCIDLRYRSPDGHFAWNDNDCYNNDLFFICEKILPV